MTTPSPLFVCPPDYHTHTELCGHAQGRPLDYLQAAIRKGIGEIACTDHCPSSVGYDPEHRMVVEQLAHYREWGAAAQHAPECRVLYGIEADYYPGCAADVQPVLASQPFDVVLGSIHIGEFWEYEKHIRQTQADPAYLTGVWRDYMRLLRDLGASGMYDVIAHLDLPKRAGVRPPETLLRECVLPVLDAIAHAGMSIEINTSGLHHPVKETYPSEQILAWSRARQIPIVFGSDAHLPERVGSDFETAVQIARAAGYTEYARYQLRQMTRHPLPT